MAKETRNRYQRMAELDARIRAIQNRFSELDTTYDLALAGKFGEVKFSITGEPRAMTVYDDLEKAAMITGLQTFLQKELDKVKEELEELDKNKDG